MKKLFGVAILAVLPVACGSTIPSGPDAQPLGTADNGSVTSQRIVRALPTPVPVPDCTTGSDVKMALVGIHVSVVSSGGGSAILRAEPVIADVDPATMCFTPVWTLNVKMAGKAFLEPLADRQQIQLYAPAGEYQVTASSGSGRSAIRGSVVVSLK